ncbi:sugar MFS transporter [Bacteroidota bacterium]
MTEKINAKRLFYLSCVALITTAMTFAIRAKLEPVWSDSFALTDVQIAWAFGTAFWGFTLAQFIGGPLVDLLGMKRLIWIAFVLHLIGIVLTLFASGFWTLFLGCLFIGVGNGSIEAACNPLVASIFPNYKTKMLNRFHVWFPGGIVIGGLASYFIMEILEKEWPWLMAVMFIPLVIYGIMMLGQKFPVTERVESGVSYTGMWKAIIKPLFLIMLFCMLLTAAIELTTTQRISVLLEGTGTSAILVLVFINGIMAVGRLFAGPIVHKIKSTGVLLFSAVISFIGLILMSYTNGGLMFLSAGVFAAGICFFWPTMLGFISEKIPDSGALGLSIFGGAGMLSVSIFLPISGWLTDNGATGSDIFRYTAILPVVLLVVFAVVFTKMKKTEK